MQELFHYPKDHIYLCSHSVGLRPKKTPWTKKFYSLWQEEGSAAWPKWLELIEEVKEKLAKLLQTEASQLCPQINVSSALAKIIPSLEKDKRRKKILLSENDFPTVGYALQGIAGNYFSLEYIPKEIDLKKISSWKKYLNDDIWLAHITHASSHTGELFPIKEISALCHARNIYSILDLAQSVGIKKINLNEIGADFATCSAIKWLSGGPGACFLWVAKNTLSSCKPKDRGWFSHQDPFSKDIYSFSYADDAKRFWGGTPNILPYAHLLDSLEIYLAIGQEKISQHNKILRNLLKEILTKNKIRTSNPKDENFSSGTLIISEKSKKLTSLLQKNKIICDDCPEGIRLSPHIYNTKEEILVLAKILTNLS